MNRKNSCKALSFKQFSILIGATTLLLYAVFALFSYQQYQQTVTEIQRIDHIAGKAELKTTILKTLDDLQLAVDKLARWDEIYQQLDQPIYFAYWYDYRIINSTALDERFMQMMLYDKQGEPLLAASTGYLPKHIERGFPPVSYKVLDNGDVRLTFIKPLQRDQTDKIAGYLAVNASLLQNIRRMNTFDLIKVDSLTFDQAEIHQLTDLIDQARFQLINSRHARLLDDLVVQLIFSLGIFIVLPTLLLLLLSIMMVGQAVRRLPRVINRLRVVGTDLDAYKSWKQNLLPEFQLAEIQEAEASLVEYQRELCQTGKVLDEKNQELWDLAHHDALTGALNRRAFDQYIDDLGRRAAGCRQAHRLMLGDINHFKAINDTYGHTTGDAVLAIVSDCLKQGLRSSDRLFRLGGDEFACVLIDCNDDQALHIAQRCEQMIRQYPFSSELELQEPVRISIGLSLSSTSCLNEDSAQNCLLQQADIAMYESKRPGNPSINFFQPDMVDEAASVYSSSVNAAINRVIEQGQGIVMHYQPVKRLQGSDDLYYEALLRVEYQGKMLSPAEIFPVIEAHRVEVELDRLVVRQILQDLQRGLIPPHSGVSINLSAQALVHDDMPGFFDGYEPFFSRYKLIIEVTETSLIRQMEAASRHLARLRKMGFLIALDDFGSGYSSLRYLTSMPVDIVKFDISMIRALADQKQATMIRHLAKMISDVNFEIVAEGIEDEVTLQRVIDCGFDYGQGFLLGRPHQLQHDADQQTAVQDL